MEMAEIKSLIDDQGKAFEAFKATLDTEMKSKLAKDDPIVTEKLAKIEKSMDDAIEAKNKFESALAAEKKEREDLEARINRNGIKATGEAEAKRELEVKEFNAMLAGVAVEQKRAFTPLDDKGYDEYKSAFNNFMRKNDRMLTPEEVKTLSVGSDPDGGYFVTPDTTGRIVRKVFETSPMRQVASVQTISTDALEGIEDTGDAGAGYAGETSQGSDTTTPQVGKWRIPVFWIDTEPKATQQLLDDAAVDIEAWLSGKVGNKFGRFENAEFVTGAADKIRGITGYTTAADSGSGVTWGTIGHVVTGVNGDFAAADKGDKLHDLMGLLKAEYMPNAAWAMKRTTITAVRKFKVSGTGTAYLWEPSFQIGQPERILGYPVVRMEDMPAHTTTGALAVAFGDFREAYQIVDRTGIRVLRDPYTAKPFIKFYTTKRTGGGVVNYEAIKFLKFST